MFDKWPSLVAFILAAFFVAKGCYGVDIPSLGVDGERFLQQIEAQLPLASADHECALADELQEVLRLMSFRRGGG